MMDDLIYVPEDFTTEEVMMYIFGASEWKHLFNQIKGATKEQWSRAYGIYISSLAWKRKRNHRIALDGNKCSTPLCFRGNDLQVHHKTYANVGDEDVENDLITLCRHCHKAEHGLGHQRLFPAVILERLLIKHPR